MAQPFMLILLLYYSCLGSYIKFTCGLLNLIMELVYFPLFQICTQWIPETQTVRPAIGIIILEMLNCNVHAVTIHWTR